MVAELTETGTVVSEFSWDGAGPVLMYRDGLTYRMVRDHVGSVRAVVDVATGAVVQRMEYDPFGIVLTDTNPGFQPFGYAGGLYDHATGMTLFGARDYDADTGVWLSKDPIGFDGGSNVYAYAANDPVNFVDLTGLSPAGSCEPAQAFGTQSECAQAQLAEEARKTWMSSLWGTESVPTKGGVGSEFCGSIVRRKDGSFQSSDVVQGTRDELGRGCVPPSAGQVVDPCLEPIDQVVVAETHSHSVGAQIGPFGYPVFSGAIAGQFGDVDLYRAKKIDGYVVLPSPFAFVTSGGSTGSQKAVQFLWALDAVGSLSGPTTLPANSTLYRSSLDKLGTRQSWENASYPEPTILPQARAAWCKLRELEGPYSGPQPAPQWMGCP